jgi:hypothetical protein
LLLAMLEKSVRLKRGSYLFCDTDFLCIVGTEKGGFVPCPGGRFNFKGKPAIRTLSLNEVASIAKKFSKLNPYDPSLVRHILKIEDVNFVDSNPQKPLRQLFVTPFPRKDMRFTRDRETTSTLKKPADTDLVICLRQKNEKRMKKQATKKFLNG